MFITNKEEQYVLITRYDDADNLVPIGDSATQKGSWNVSLAEPIPGLAEARRRSSETKHEAPADALRAAHNLMKEYGAPLVLDLQEVRLFNQKSIEELADSLTFEIHESLPGHDDEDFRGDDFENHVLSELREAAVELSEELADCDNGPSL